MTDKQNFVVTFSLVSVTFVCSVFVRSIADVILIVGATCNTLVGFTLPIMFYLAMDSSRGSQGGVKRYVAHFINISLVLLSASSLYFFAL
jgi:amino acid permease